jgi:hypothetical protein
LNSTDGNYYDAENNLVDKDGVYLDPYASDASGGGSGGGSGDDEEEDDNGEVNTDSNLKVIFEYETLYLIFWVVAGYFIIYSFLSFFFNYDSLGYVFNLMILSVLLILFLIYKFFESDSDTKDDLHANIDNFLKFFEDKYNVLYLALGILMVHIIVKVLKIPSEPDSKPTLLNGLETLLYILLVLVLFVLGFKEILDVSLTDELRKRVKMEDTSEEKDTDDTGDDSAGDDSAGDDSAGDDLAGTDLAGTDLAGTDLAGTDLAGSDLTGSDLTSSGQPGMLRNATSYGEQIMNNIQNQYAQLDLLGDGNEVFNIGGNHYTYDDAEAICKSFDAELANYDQLEDAYRRGGEWCNYGWSKNQMALFPTQKATWSKLQENEKSKHNCGRPGINGGYMANPALRFGVNCYGKKPAKRDTDFGPVNMTYVSPEEEKAKTQAEFWKSQHDKMRLNQYDRDRWSRY